MCKGGIGSGVAIRLGLDGVVVELWLICGCVSVGVEHT